MIINDDAIVAMKKLPEKSVDLVLTSPPYAEQRKSHYNSIPEKNYPEWTKEWMSECKRILKDKGNVAVVIRTNIRKGAISPYIINTRLKLWEDGWIEPEELVWIKPSSPPLGSLNRPRRAWEQVLWFSMSNKAYCDVKANGLPSKRIGFQSKKGLGDWKNGCNIPKEGIARSKDYFEVGAGSVDKSKSNTHPAQYPEELAAQIIKMLCPINGTVLDPFLGSGTTAVAAIKNNRSFIGIDVDSNYCEIAKNRLEKISKN